MLKFPIRYESNKTEANYLILWRTAAPTSPAPDTVAASSVISLLGKVVRRL